MEWFCGNQHAAVSQAIAACQALTVGHGVQLLLLEIDETQIFHIAP